MPPALLPFNIVRLRALPLALLAVAVLQLPTSLRAQPAAPAPLTLRWCLERAETMNPQLAVERAGAEAASHRIVPAGALDDPRVSYAASNVPLEQLDFDSTPLSGHQFGLMQKIPFPGVLGNREAAAYAALQASNSSVDDRERAIASAVETAWAQLGFAQRALEITEQNIDLLRQLAATAEAKYRVGTGIQQDVLRAHVELTALLKERLDREAAIQTSGSMLVALLDLPPATEFARTEPLAEDAPLPQLEKLFARLEEGSPRLASLRARIEEAKRRRRVAELEGYPDFDLGVGYRFRKDVVGDPVKGEDFISASVTVRLPVNRGKWRARVAERDSLLRREQARYRGAVAQLQAGLRRAFAELVRSDSELTLLETGLLPQARQSLESSRSGYGVGRIDFLSLLDSQVRLLNAELRLVRSARDRRAAFAALEAAVGERLR